MKNIFMKYMALFFLLGAMGVNAQTQLSFVSAEEAVSAMMIAVEKNDPTDWGRVNEHLIKWP